MAHGLNVLTTKLPTSLGSTCAVAAGTDIYLFGGTINGGKSVSIFKFDTITKTLTSLVTTLPEVSSDLRGGYCDGKIYLLKNSSTYWIFDPTPETIEASSAKFSKYNSSNKPFFYDDDIFGISTDGVIFLYNIYGTLINSYEQTLRSSWSNASCCYCNGSYYLLGGYNGGSGTFINNIYKFNYPSSLGTVASMVNNINMMFEIAVVGTKIYIFGGGKYIKENNTIIPSTVYSTIQYFDTETQKLLNLSVQLPTQLQYTGQVAVVGEKVYIFGGYDYTNSTYVDTILEFDTNAQVIIIYNGSTVADIGGERTATLACAGKKAVGDIVVKFDVAGSITYDEVTTECNYGQTATLACAGKKMKTDVVINTHST